MHRLIIFLFFSITFSFADIKPTIAVLATGGTISATANSSTSSIYKTGSLSGSQIIASIPELKNIANINFKQIYNKDSSDLKLTDWLMLTNEVNKIASSPEINGIVIIHGTDSLSETAYFLHLAAKTKKPIILVGAMRPATSLSADGSLNLYNAVNVAANPASFNRGVLVVMNDKIFSGRYVTKANTTTTNAFESPNIGPIGTVVLGKVSYNTKIIRPFTSDTPFYVTGVNNLPNVAIIYEYVGVDTTMLDAILNTNNLKGIIIAGFGNGNIPVYEKDFLIKAHNKGIIIVRSSRVSSGTVTYNYNNLDTTYDLITADDLNPEKARILLMLSLLYTNDVKKIQEDFYKY
ncbi:MAG TPA: asparaginase [Burkholderiales bacterium]|mgnify:CR=1 FL=1|nr:asparaginase [Burkholderiales bacterium]